MKAASLYLLALVVGLYTAFVLMNLWNWFAAPALGVAPIAYWQMVGLNLLVMAVLERDTLQEDKRWERVFTMIQTAVPEDSRQEIADQIRADNESVMFDVGWMVMTKVFTNTGTLGLGWLLHTLMAS